MEFTLQEAIHIVVGFYLPLGGFWRDEKIERNEICRFITAGFASLDSEYGDKYVINAMGKTHMHPYIEKISELFISFMHSKCSECAHTEAQEWFDSYFQLNDSETAREICDYICTNLDLYGYRILDCYSGRKGKFY